MSKPLDPSDPAYFMLEQGIKDPTKWSQTTVFKDGCYICEDPEFAIMGMSLCYPCPKCGGHIAADEMMCGNGCEWSYE